MTDTTQEKRGRGRPKGSRNKRKYVSALDSLDDLTPKAVRKIREILDEDIKGTTPAQILAAAKLVLEIAEKQAQKEEAADSAEEQEKPSVDNDFPVVRLSAKA
jgi:hypothetical protein